MKRRKFISITSIATVTGVVAPNLLISCSSADKINLNEIIGQPEKLLEQFPKEGDSDFAYYKTSNFKHDLITGKETFIYCQKGKIIGYTIRKKGINKKEAYSKQLSHNYGARKQLFINDFGEEYEWRTKSKKITLCYSSEQKNLEKNTYYSEALLGEQLIIF